MNEHSNLFFEGMDFKFIKGDCTILMKNLPDNSVNAIITDPPWKYLKNQKLEKDFDEKLFFGEAKRILKIDGFIVLFGRGESFYRWNYMLTELGFTFKEEIIWDKSYTTSSMHPISRCHETIAIFSKAGKIHNVRVPYIEIKDEKITSIHQDLKRIKSALNNPKEIEALEKYINDRTVEFGENKKRGYNTTIHGVSKEQCRSVKTLQAITAGMKEKSIINVKREHYKTIHPTQKPVRLIERLLALTTKKCDLVLDPFAGSCSTGIACRNTGRNFIGFEIDEEYYGKALDRINGKNPNGFEKADAGGKKINYGQTELNFD